MVNFQDSSVSDKSGKKILFPPADYVRRYTVHGKNVFGGK
jgi:hypothetical protein